MIKDSNILDMIKKKTKYAKVTEWDVRETGQIVIGANWVRYVIGYFWSLQM